MDDDEYYYYDYYHYIFIQNSCCQFHSYIKLCLNNSTIFKLVFQKRARRLPVKRQETTTTTGQLPLPDEGVHAERTPDTKHRDYDKPCLLMNTTPTTLLDCHLRLSQRPMIHTCHQFTSCCTNCMHEPGDLSLWLIAMIRQ